MKFTDRVGETSKRQMTDEGYLLVRDARIARTGIQQYLSAELRKEDGSPQFPDREPTDIINVNRPESEVFSEETMQSFEMQPVTNGHPEEGVTVLNHEGLAVGVAFKIRREGIFMLAHLKITNPDTINDIGNGKRELSNGYTADVVVRQGKTEDGQLFDAEQLNIRGNHVAIVDKARCGPVCSLSDNQPNEGFNMKITISGVPFEVKDESLAAAVQNVLTQNAELNSKLSAAQATNDAAIDAVKETHSAEVQKLQAQLDQAQANEMTPEKLDVIIADRMEIVTKAQKIFTDYDATGKTCMQVKRDTLKAKFGDAISDEKMENDIYVDARFDALTESGKEKPTSTPTEKLLSDAAYTVKNIADYSPSELARKRKSIADSIAYKFPVGVRHSRHKDHAAYEAAITAELERQKAAK